MKVLSKRGLTALLSAVLVLALLAGGVGAQVYGTYFESLIVGKQLYVDPAATVTLPGGVVSASSMVFEGATADAYETTLAITDPTADRTITLPNSSGTVLLGAGATTAVFGSSTITATLAITTSTHGLTTPLYAFCDLAQDGADDQEQHCTTAISGSTITIKVWKEAGAAGDSGVLVNWLAAGTP